MTATHTRHEPRRMNKPLAIYVCLCCKRYAISAEETNSAIAEVCSSCWYPCAYSREKGGYCVRNPQQGDHKARLEADAPMLAQEREG